jgi:predicted transposase/invertase (TIGR01784 family)
MRRRKSMENDREKRPLLKPSNDLVFKAIFSDENHRNILRSLLQSILSLPAEEYSHIEIVDPHSRLYRPDDKLMIMDIKLHTKSGHIIDVEMQIATSRQLRDRILRYASSMITEQVKSGENYTLKKAITILITKDTLIKDSDYYSYRYHLYDKERQSLFSDKLEINVLELSKLPAQTDSSDLYDWLMFLKTDREEDYEMLAQKSPVFGEAVMVLKVLSADERMRLLAEAREKAVLDEMSRLDEAVEEAEKRVRQEEDVKRLKLLQEQEAIRLNAIQEVRQEEEAMRLKLLQEQEARLLQEQEAMRLKLLREQEEKRLADKKAFARKLIRKGVMSRADIAEASDLELSVVESLSGD